MIHVLLLLSYFVVTMGMIREFSKSFVPNPPPDKTSASGKRILPQGQPRVQEIANPNRLKIIAGSAKGRKIDSPDVYLRPMMAKVREALFSTLTHMSLFERGDARILDMFAGAGSVGLESLSRGAAFSTFVDLSPDCTATALRNVEKCGFRKDQANAVCARVEDVLDRPLDFGLTQPYHLVSLTPPYQEVSYPQLIASLCTTSLLMEDSLVLLEYPIEMGVLPAVLGEQQMVGLRNRRYGRTCLAMYINRPSRLYDIRPEEFELVETKGKGKKPKQ